jgi:3'-phosphoadenosine 5'-phosphosulfate sulfotransferase (PAPS reductase)/FAD synthetase
MALRLREVHQDRDYEYLITPTGKELPEMGDHWRRLEDMLGKPLIHLQPFGDQDGLLVDIRQQAMIPNFRARFCTKDLKIKPTIKWLTEHAPAVQYVGLRADEPERRGLYGDIPDVTQCYPLREWGWGIDDVLGYLDSRGVTIPTRTDCALCFFQRLLEWKRLWRDHPEAYRVGVKIEAEMGHTFRSAGRDSWPADLAGLAEEFEKGKQVRGEERARQMELFNCDRESLCRVCSM